MGIWIDARIEVRTYTENAQNAIASLDLFEEFELPGKFRFIRNKFSYHEILKNEFEAEVVVKRIANLLKDEGTVSATYECEEDGAEAYTFYYLGDGIKLVYFSGSDMREDNEHEEDDEFFWYDDDIYNGTARYAALLQCDSQELKDISDEIWTEVLEEDIPDDHDSDDELIYWIVSIMNECVLEIGEGFFSSPHLKKLKEKIRQNARICRFESHDFVPNLGWEAKGIAHFSDIERSFLEGNYTKVKPPAASEQNTIVKQKSIPKPEENKPISSKTDWDNAQNSVQHDVDQVIKKGIIEDSLENRDAVAAATTFVYETIVKQRIEQAKNDLYEQTQNQKKNGQKIIHIPSSARIDYQDDALYEAALNKGEKTEGKIVRFKVLAVKPKSEFGFNLWAGEHLNFCTQEGFPVKEGDTILAKVSKVDHCIGSWIIYYDRLEYETRETPLSMKDNTVNAYHPETANKAENITHRDGILQTKYKTRIRDREFANYKDLRNIVIPEGIIAIGKSAFSGSSVVSVTLPTTLREIEQSAFENCPNLKSVKCNEGLEKIDYAAFSGCPKLFEIKLPDSIKELDCSAFSLKVEYNPAAETSVTNIILPENLAKELKRKGDLQGETQLVSNWIIINGKYYRGLSEYADLCDYNSAAEAEKKPVQKQQTDSNVKKLAVSSAESMIQKESKNNPLYPNERYCDLCGRQIEEDEEYETLADGEYICVECEASVCGKCSNCDQIYRKEELTEEEDGYYCPDCHEAYFAQCEECGRMTLKEDLALVGSRKICPKCFSNRRNEINEDNRNTGPAVDYLKKSENVQKEHIEGETAEIDTNAAYLLFKTLNEQILNNVEEQAKIDTGLLSWKLTTIDYPDEDDFEKALSNGASVERKTVCFKVIDIIPKSEYGFKLNAGEHLCFVSKHKVDVNAGQFVTVRAVKTVNLFGTWFITYDLMKVTNTRVDAEIKEDKQQKHETAQTVTPVVDSSSFYLVIREGKSIIREQEFAGSNYKYIGLPKSLKFIEKGAFENCPMLENIGIKEGLTSIDAYAFSNCPELREIHLPETTKYIDENAFVDRGPENRSHIVVHLSGDTAYSLETTRKFYSRNAFTAKRFEIDGRKYQDLASYVKEKDEKRAAEEKAIWNTEKPAVKEVKATPHKLEIQEGITRISNREYAKSTYISVKLPKSLREIGSYAFESCPELRAVEMQEGLNIIGPYAFSNCPNLQHIYLPESIQSVDRTAFVEEEANLRESHITVHMSGNTAMYLEKKNRFSSVSTIVARDFVIAGERYTDISDYTGVRKAEESEAEKRRKEINEQIYKLIAERDSIKGLFSGMKRKKIQKVIDELRNQLEKG